MKARRVNMKQIGSTLLNNTFKENFYRTVKDKDFLCLSTDLSDSLYDKWVKENKPSEFFASWEKDSSSYKDDSVEIFFK